MILHTVQNAMRLAAYLLKLLTGGYGTVSALHIACWEGSTDAVNAVTSGKRTVVKDWHERAGDLTPLHISAMCGHTAVVEYLLQLDVNANIPTVHGMRALHISASSNFELSEALVLGKADAGLATADSDTPLHYASCYQQLPTMELLLRAGVNAATANAFGVVPLHVAAAYAALEGLRIHEANAVLLLLSHKADPMARDKHGRTPADVAIMAGGDPSLVEFLRGAALAAPREGLTLENGPAEGMAARMQSMATEMMKESRAADLASPSGDGLSPADGCAEELDGLAAAMRSGRSKKSPPSDLTPASDFRLHEENAQLSAEVKRLAKELEEARSKNRHLDELLQNTRGTMEQMQNMKSNSHVTSHSQNNEAIQSIKEDLEQQRGEFLRRNQDLDAERERWREEREAMQRLLDEAVAARDVATLNVGKDAAAEEAAAVARAALQNRPTSADLRAKETELQERLGEKDAELESQVKAKEAELEARAKAEEDARAELGEKAAELEARALAESEARVALGQKETELSQKDGEIVALRQEVERQSSDAEVKAKEITRQATTIEGLQSEARSIGADLQKQRREKEEVFQQLSDLRTQHTQLREEGAQAQLTHQEAESSFREQELALEGKVREQELCTKNLQEDLTKTQAVVKDLEDCKERAERADRMLAPLNQRIEELHRAFAHEQALRKRYHNQMQEAKGAIRVYARIRPMIKREEGQEVAARRVDAFTMELDSKDKRAPPKTFTFDSIFNEHNTQEDVFADCRSLVSSAVDGYNVTVFAYGQTGAGKTHTMYGNEKAPGLVPRVADEIFGLLSKYSHEAVSKVRCSMFELYRDDLVDLFLPKAKARNPPPLDVKKDTRGSVFVDNATEREAGTAEELLQAITEGQERRHVSATKMNSDSSRSHLIAILVIESTNRKTKQVSTGKLTLCDLAGSERLKKSEATGEQMKEAQSINKSLSALGDVIEALTKHAKHVPYRNHKLTQLLSDSLGGNAKTLMFVNCSPVAPSLDETGAALGYAARAKLIMNKVEKNQDSQEVARLKKVIQVMSGELEQARAGQAELAPPGPA